MKCSTLVQVRVPSACDAAARGVQVTAVDTSSAMLARLSARFAAAEQQANVVCGDVHDLDGSFDAIVAPFFFNVFSRAQLEQAMNRLSKHLRPNGLLVSVDFHAPSDSVFVRLIQKCYYLPPLALFHLATQETRGMNSTTIDKSRSRLEFPLPSSKLSPPRRSDFRFSRP